MILGKTMLASVLASSLLLTLISSSVAALPPHTSQSAAKSSYSEMIVNGATFSSADAARYEAALADVRHTVVESDGTTYGYTNKADADQHIERIANEPRAEHGGGVSPIHFKSKFYDLTNFKGDLWEVPWGTNIPDFHTWSDKISSLKITYGYSGVRLFEHNNYWGSSIYLAKSAEVQDLGSRFLYPNKTWDNQASSLQFIGKEE
ncbi:hypothetical protein [Paenibacillus sp. 481]|uniref:hypothetical protein n=1 Tax=Paenibacillus sp. 481 TaxID=2835869 RepID=UPI001E5DF149|nr:hypothetical protein [Paenibacillus sp. 481]UHA71855.1 hypothetical protein KIK04_14025 [Paenibacillus sp. 481]